MTPRLFGLCRIAVLAALLAFLPSAPAAAQGTTYLLRTAPQDRAAVLARYQLTVVREIGDPAGQLVEVAFAAQRQLGPTLLTAPLVRRQATPLVPGGLWAQPPALDERGGDDDGDDDDGDDDDDGGGGGGDDDDDIDDDPQVLGFEEVDDLEITDLRHDQPFATGPGPVTDAVAQDPSFVNFNGTPAWRGYVAQPATARISLDFALGQGTGTGTRVAILDTGIDPDHPLFAGVLLPGRDFVNGRPGTASEWIDVAANVQQAFQAGASGDLSQSTVAILWQSTVAILWQSTVAILWGEPAPGSPPPVLTTVIPPAFGHGTMVAGLVRRSAPGARILPVKTFDGQGRSDTATVLAAIYWALEQDVDVLNLSFSLETTTPELERAIATALERGVYVVAAAGNRATSQPTFPGTVDGVEVVAAVDLADQRSAFTNFGSAWVDLAAPGEQLITAFPGGTYAAAGGTSFSAPLVAGSAALMLDLAGTGAPRGAERVPFLTQVLEHTVELPPEAGLGAGRLDLEKAIVEGLP